MVKKYIWYQHAVCLKQAIEYQTLIIIHFYQNRHNFAVNLLQAGASYNQTARMLGHTSSAMVINRYGNYQEDLADMVFLK